VNREVRKERLREAFGINRTEARYLSRLYEATTEKPLR
jgi:hypothetical protein